jgi:hypothetical protein
MIADRPHAGHSQTLADVTEVDVIRTVVGYQSGVPQFVGIFASFGE